MALTNYTPGAYGAKYNEAASEARGMGLGASGLGAIGQGVERLQGQVDTGYADMLKEIEELKKYISDDELNALLKSTAIQSVQQAGISPETVQQQIGADQAVTEERYASLLSQLDEYYNEKGQFGSASHQAAKQRLLQDKEGALAESRRKWTMWGETEGQNQLMQSLGMGQGIAQGNLAGLTQITGMGQNVQKGQISDILSQLDFIRNQVAQGGAVNPNVGLGGQVKQGQVTGGIFFPKGM